jgi:hypothetical protein
MHCSFYWDCGRYLLHVKKMAFEQLRRTHGHTFAKGVCVHSRIAAKEIHHTKSKPQAKRSFYSIYFNLTNLSVAVVVPSLHLTYASLLIDQVPAPVPRN